MQQASCVFCGVGLRRVLMFGGLALSLLLTSGATAQAAGWSVYIYNTCRPQDGWYRSGFADDIDTSEAACLRSIRNRISSARSRGTDREHYIIVYYNRYPPQTLQSGYVTYKYIYNGGTCRVQPNPNPPRCQYPYYIIYTYNGQTGSLGGYRTEAEAYSYGQNLNRQSGFRFVRVRYVCN